MNLFHIIPPFRGTTQGYQNFPYDLLGEVFLRYEVVGFVLAVRTLNFFSKKNSDQSWEVGHEKNEHRVKYHSLDVIDISYMYKFS